MRLLLLALAGSFGTLARYGVALLAQNFAQATGFPLGTLIVNVVGSFLLGFVATVAVTRIPAADLRLVVGVGFLGAFTTFSTFELDCFRLLEEKAYLRFGLYATGNLLLGLFAVLAGRLVAQRVS
ncbi:MAG: fluoride efflux transporter CrcB [Fimbriimonas sp.]